MGRYYTGDICGKFWFGIQSSDDPENFGAELYFEYTFFGCGCCATDYINDDKPYCQADYTSFKDQMDKTKEDRYYYKDEDKNKMFYNSSDEDKNRTFYKSSDEVRYEFSKNDLLSVTETLNTLEEKYAKFIQEYKIKDDEDEGIGYNMKTTNNLSQDDLVYVARLCLGRQIKYCLEKKGKCSFFAEL